MVRIMCKSFPSAPPSSSLRVILVSADTKRSSRAFVVHLCIFLHVASIFLVNDFFVTPSLLLCGGFSSQLSQHLCHQLLFSLVSTFCMLLSTPIISSFREFKWFGINFPHVLRFKMAYFFLINSLWVFQVIFPFYPVFTGSSMYSKNKFIGLSVPILLDRTVDSSCRLGIGLQGRFLLYIIRGK